MKGIWVGAGVIVGIYAWHASTVWAKLVAEGTIGLARGWQTPGTLPPKSEPGRLREPVASSTDARR